MALVQVESPGRDGTEPGVNAAAADTTGTTPRWQVAVASFAALILVWLLSVFINATFRPRTLVIPAGISLFAMFFAVTQGVERLLEPISSFFFSTKRQTQQRNVNMACALNLDGTSDESLPAMLTDLVEAWRAAEDLQGKAKGQPAARGVLRRNAAADRVAAAHERLKQAVEAAVDAGGRDAGIMRQALADVLKVSPDEAPAVCRKAALKLAAGAQAELDQRRADKAVAYWALATSVGLLLSATLGLYLMHVVGLQGDGLAADGTWSGTMNAAGVRHSLDILVTGLAVGGGTKPLHDLISNLQAAKDNRKNPSQTL
jgi:hypothetical protein